MEDTYCIESSSSSSVSQSNVEASVMNNFPVYAKRQHADFEVRVSNKLV